MRAKHVSILLVTAMLGLGFFTACQESSPAKITNDASSEVRIEDYYSGKAHATSGPLGEAPTNFRVTKNAATTDLVFEYKDSAGDWQSAGAYTIPKKFQDDKPTIGLVSSANGVAYQYNEVVCTGLSDGASSEDDDGTVTFTGEGDTVKFLKDDAGEYSWYGEVSYESDSFSLTCSAPGADNAEKPTGYVCPGGDGTDNGDNDVWLYFDLTKSWQLSWNLNGADSGWAGLSFWIEDAGDSEWHVVNFVCQY